MVFGKVIDKFINFGTGSNQVSEKDMPADYSPSNYTPTQVASEGTDKTSAHLKGIDLQLSTNLTKRVYGFAYPGDSVGSKLTDHEVVSKFIYRGSTDLGTITTIKAIVRKEAGATSGTIKIYDVTHAHTIAELTFTENIDTIKDLGSISNVSTTESIFEIQLKRTGGSSSDEIFCQAINLTF